MVKKRDKKENGEGIRWKRKEEVKRDDWQQNWWERFNFGYL